MTTAEVTLQEALEGAPENWSIRMALLEQLRSRGDVEGVVRVISEAVVSPATDEEMVAIMGMCQEAENPGAAAPLLKAYLLARPQSPTAHFLYAQLLTIMGDLSRAQEHLQTAMDLNDEQGDSALAMQIEELASTLANPSPRSETAALVSLHKTGRIHPLPPQEIGEGEHIYEADVPPPGEEWVEQPAEDVVAPEDQTPRVRPRRRRGLFSQKVSALTIAILVHLAALLGFASVIINQPQKLPPEIIAQAPVLTDEVIIEKKEIQEVIQREPVQASLAQREVMAVAGISNVALPKIETDLQSDDPLGIGDSFGASISFSAGDDGGMVSFFGMRNMSKRVVFAVDYSLSMRPQGKDRLMRKELEKALNALPGGIEYQCVFFHGPAWYHGQDVIEGNPDRREDWIHYHVKQRHPIKVWKWYSGDNEKSRIKKGKRVNTKFHPESGSTRPDLLPKADYIVSNKQNISKSIRAVHETRLGLGTDWRWPLYMAINMEPDTIFFMTDGAFKAKGNVLNDIVEYAKANGNPKINTTCMMVPQAMDELTFLARKTRGDVSLVLRDQTVLRGDELKTYLKNNQKK